MARHKNNFCNSYFPLEHLIPLDERNKLSQGLPAKASPCHNPLQQKPIDFSKCVKSFLLGQTGAALKENTVKVFLGGPKYGKHNTSCWEWQGVCVYLFTGVLLGFGIHRLLLYCQMSPSMCVHHLKLFIEPSYGCLRADGSWSLHLENVYLQVFGSASNHFSQAGSGNRPSCQTFPEPIWKQNTHLVKLPNTVCVWSAACCREMRGHMPSAEQPCTKQRKEDA